MKRHGILIVIRRILLLITGTLLMALLAVAGVVYVILCGPSESAQELLTRSMKETSAIGFIPDLYLSEDRVAEIMSYKDTVIETQEVNTSLITISATKKKTDTEVQDGSDMDSMKDDSGVEFVEITGAAYRGIMMIVEDPTRMFIGVPDSFGDKGLELENLIKKYDATGGINAGGFYDPGGNGTGGIPDGIVITNGELIWGNKNTISTVIGFDEEGILHVGKMSGKEALERKIQWACSFGPVLIVNGESQADSLPSGVNPRTAIGQRADGAVLLLVIDGRQITSLGATLEDLAGIMFEYGAVNAANLDGGSSSQMIYNNKSLNVNVSVRGPRPMPTAFLVK